MKQKMTPVKENRAYVKGEGACVNVDETAYTTRLQRLRAQQSKDNEIKDLKCQVNKLTNLVEQLLAKG